MEIRNEEQVKAKEQKWSILVYHVSYRFQTKTPSKETVKKQ